MWFVSFVFVFFSSSSSSIPEGKSKQHNVAFQNGTRYTAHKTQNRQRLQREKCMTTCKGGTFGREMWENEWKISPSGQTVTLTCTKNKTKQKLKAYKKDRPSGTRIRRKSSSMEHSWNGLRPFYSGLLHFSFCLSNIEIRSFTVVQLMSSFVSGCCFWAGGAAGAFAPSFSVGLLLALPRAWQRM